MQIGVSTCATHNNAELHETDLGINHKDNNTCLRKHQIIIPAGILIAHLAGKIPYFEVDKGAAKRRVASAVIQRRDLAH